jgi:hypothetical protein
VYDLLLASSGTSENEPENPQGYSMICIAALAVVFQFTSNILGKKTVSNGWMKWDTKWSLYGPLSACFL